MTTLAPTTQDTVYQLAAQMMAALPWGAAGDADRARIDKALDLVGSVERMADRPNLFLVTSQSVANTAYQVHQGQCNCPDASRRDARRCKHAVAVDLFKRAERADAEQSDPTLDADPSCYELTGKGCLMLVPVAALPNPIGTCTRLPYTTAQRAIASELYDDLPQGAA